MVKQPQRTDRCFLPATGSSAAWVRFPVSPAQKRPPPPQQGSGTGNADSRPCCSYTTTEEGADVLSQLGAPGVEGGPLELDSKRARMEGTEELAAPPSRDRGACASVADVPHLEQEGAAEHSEGSRAPELQSVGSLKVTIQQSSESREFGQTDRTAERPTGGLHCHVCHHTCRSLQVFQEHMSGPEHMKKLQEITHSICLNTHALQDRGCRPEAQRWCDTCQTHFSGDVIVHRRTKQHKMCKQICRPFCPVCRRYFRTPRKFVEHMKSPEHKQQVHLEEAQEEELITVDAVGCFEEEEEEQGMEKEVDVAEEGEDAGPEESKEEASEIGEEEEEDSGEYDSNTTCGSSFVVPVCGFVCRLCKKFFYNESAARGTHCRTHTHYLHLKKHRAQRRRRRRRRGQRDEEEGSAVLT